MQRRSRSTHNTVDELHVARALSVAVASSVLGTSLVVREFGHATVLVHSGQVERAVETAGEIRHVDVEGELLVEELQHLVVCVIGHEVDARADVGTRHELKREGAAGGRDTVGARVVGTVERAVLRAGRAVGAEGSVPFVARVAVGVPANVVQPTPVGVEDDLGGQVLAATALSALLRRQSGVVLGRVGTSLLGGDHGEVGKCGEGNGAEHGYRVDSTGVLDESSVKADHEKEGRAYKFCKGTRGNEL